MARKNEFGEEINLEEPKTFAESEGLPANKHAKELAKKASAEKKAGASKVAFYTRKGDSKILKILVSLKGVYQVYIGNLKRHKDGLDPLMKKWKAEGLWIEPHAVDEKVLEIRKQLNLKKK